LTGAEGARYNLQALNTSLRTLLAAALALSLTACLKRVPKPKVPEHRAVKLLLEVPERETAQLTDLRKDLEVDTHDMDRTPHLVEAGETPVIELGSARARLAGNAEGTEAWSVDNFLLFDVLDANGEHLSSFVVGSAAGVLRGNERLDNVGRMAFRFEGGEVDVTSHLPASKPFKLKVTALDYGGVGRVSNVFLVLDRAEHVTGSDDLRGE
jgi:hypothetical protein